MSVTIRFLPLILLMFITVPARGYDVLVSVTGNVIGNTCIVSEDSKEQNVPLGTLGVKQFSEAGAVSNIKTPFTLTLEACGPTFAGVKIRFSGTPDDENRSFSKSLTAARPAWRCRFWIKTAYLSRWTPKPLLTARRGMTA